MIRRDLERVERLAGQVLEGLSAEDVRQQLDEIKRDGMLWRLQVNCLRYCRFVHLHHNAEDRDFFPELRETNPAINPVIDRLQADHRRVSDELDAVEAAANALAEDDGKQTRTGGGRHPSGPRREPARPSRLRRAEHSSHRLAHSRAGPDRVEEPATLEVGVSIIPYADSLDRPRAGAGRRRGRAGARRGPGPPLSAPLPRHLCADRHAAGRDERISFFTDVANLPLRPPAVMAKAAASLDVLSGGRFELGLGAGALPGCRSPRMGGPRRSPGSRSTRWRRRSR